MKLLWELKTLLAKAKGVGVPMNEIDYSNKEEWKKFVEEYVVPLRVSTDAWWYGDYLLWYSNRDSIDE